MNTFSFGFAGFMKQMCNRVIKTQVKTIVQAAVRILISFSVELARTN